MDEQPIEEQPADEPYEAPVAEAVEGPDPDSVPPGTPSGF
jgi:hypothetical protein